MSFGTLLGNQRIQENLEKSLGRGHISHFYLISGPEGAGKHTLARLLAAAILCSGEGKPCLHCNPCRKVMGDIHPDFITIDDPEKKTVPVDLIRQARSDIYIQPNEAEHKVYLFPRAQDMGLPGQNALLKVLEEPPGYGVFILLTDNPDKLLPTVRSRCTELSLQALPEDILLPELARRYPDSSREDLQAAAARSGGFLGQAIALLENHESVPPQTEGFVKALCQGSSLLLVQTLVPMEKWKRDALLPILRSWMALCQSALAGRSGGAMLSPLARELCQNCSAQKLYQALEGLKEAYHHLESNVSPGAVCGYLEWILR